MNEILANLYYCFWNIGSSYSTDNDEDISLFREYFESDIFFTFTSVMSEIRDGFLRAMDSEPTGINGRIKTFEFYLK